jgi:hypothetical protein
MMSAQLPAEVVALALAKSKAEGRRLTPIAWSIQPEAITIVFEEGPKYIFERNETQSRTDTGMASGAAQTETTPRKPKAAKTAPGSSTSA